MKNIYKIIIINISMLLSVTLCNAQYEERKYPDNLGNSWPSFYDISKQREYELKKLSPDIREESDEENAGESEEEVDNDALKFSRWKSFWENRMGDAIDKSPTGNFRHYIGALSTLSSTPICTSSSLYPATWSLLGPQQLPRQEIGRIDALAIDPVNSSVAYAGAPNSGLW